MSTRQRRDITTYSLAVAEPEVDLAEFPATARWAGVIGMENEMTGDGRAINADALTWEITEDNRPPIRYVAEDVGLHDGAVTVGNFDLIERRFVLPPTIHLDRANDEICDDTYLCHVYGGDAQRRMREQNTRRDG